MSIIGRINDNFDNLPDILSEYDKEIELAKDRLAMKGRKLSECIVEQPVWYSHYEKKRVDLKTLNNFFEQAIKVRKGEVYQIILKESKLAHSERGKDRLIDSSPKLTLLNDFYIEVNDVYMRMEGVVKAFEQRSYSLNNLVKLYEKDLEHMRIEL